MMAEHGVITSDYTAHSVEVLLLDGSSSTTSFIPSGWSLAGSNVGDSVPAQVAMIFTLRTALGGRSHRGRIYVAGLPAGAVETDSTQWKASGMSDFQDMADAFTTALGPGPNGCELVVASYTLASAASVTSSVARRYFGTQRRRVN